VLVFDPSERQIADDLQRQFVAISKLPEAERVIKIPESSTSHVSVIRGLDVPPFLSST
jgi:hypothetical protein